MGSTSENPTSNDQDARVWLVRAGRQGEDDDANLEKGLAIIGWQEVQDLTGVMGKEEVQDRLRAWHQDPHITAVSQLTAFTVGMQIDDIVALPLKTRPGQIALGRVAGQYEYQEVDGIKRHTRRVHWIRTDVPRSYFGQDLLYSLGSLLTICRIQRNEAGRRIATMLEGGKDPEIRESERTPKSNVAHEGDAADDSALPNINDVAHQQILDHIRLNFSGHDLARLVEGVLKAEGYFTHLSTPGPDGGVDILAGQGTVGFDPPRICVQVKATEGAADVNVLRSLQGTLATFNADQGLLVSWGGFTSSTRREARQSFFKVRLWDANDLIHAVYQSYERLSEQIRADIPLERVWTLVRDDEGS